MIALRAALVDGTIDIIATDHAPHPVEAKDCEWSAAAFGMVGLETAASVAQLVLIESGKSNWQRFAEVLSHAPARIGQDEGCLAANFAFEKGPGSSNRCRQCSQPRTDRCQENTHYRG